MIEKWEFKKVWVVDCGAYENNCIGWIFTSKGEADKYASAKNREAEEEERRSGYRSMDSHYHVSSYEVADTADEANSEDLRLHQLYEADPDAWKKNLCTPAE